MLGQGRGLSLSCPNQIHGLHKVVLFARAFRARNNCHQYDPVRLGGRRDSLRTLANRVAEGGVTGGVGWAVRDWQRRSPMARPDGRLREAARANRRCAGAGQECSEPGRCDWERRREPGRAGCAPHENALGCRGCQWVAGVARPGLGLGRGRRGEEGSGPGRCAGGGAGPGREPWGEAVTHFPGFARGRRG